MIERNARELPSVEPGCGLHDPEHRAVKAGVLMCWRGRYPGFPVETYVNLKQYNFGTWGDRELDAYGRDVVFVTTGRKTVFFTGNERRQNGRQAFIELIAPDGKIIHARKYSVKPVVVQIAIALR